jgi:1-acyl-sn-glycerol-3-phosphate acyltransferase
MQRKFEVRNSLILTTVILVGNNAIFSPPPDPLLLSMLAFPNNVAFAADEEA